MADQNAFLAPLIASGPYPSRSAVFEAGLERRWPDVEDETVDRQALRALMAGGPAETPITAFPLITLKPLVAATSLCCWPDQPL